MADAAAGARLLGMLTERRLVELGREFAVALPASAAKEAQVDWLIRKIDELAAMDVLAALAERETAMTSAKQSGLHARLRGGTDERGR
jgi:hypothetical protein